MGTMLSEIQKLVLSGRMGEAIDTTQQLYIRLIREKERERERDTDNV